MVFISLDGIKFDLDRQIATRVFFLIHGEGGILRIAEVAACVSSPGSPGCLLSIGGALKTVIDKIFGLMQQKPSVQIKDPNDLQGTDGWTITRGEAQAKTQNDGAYGFMFDMPTTYNVSCLGWYPCTVTSPTRTIITMRVRLKFCLVRDGVPDSDLQKVCSPYEFIYLESLPSPTSTSP